MLFLASETLLFAALFGSYFALAAANEEWPPEGVELDVLRAAVFTAVFALSAVTMWLSVRSARDGRESEANRWLAVTALLGLVFAVNTFVELATAEFGLTTDAYGSIYFLTVGIHWLHVVAALAIVALAVVVTTGRGRAPLGDTRAAAGYFWYFTVAVSVAVLVVVYLVQ
jgi:heme/copper-type cytochrome/quinol oxidase subunit 3